VKRPRDGAGGHERQRYNHEGEPGPGKHDRPQMACHARAALIFKVLVLEGEGVDSAVHFVGEPRLAKRLLRERLGKLRRVAAKHQLESGRGGRREVGTRDLGGGEGHGDGRVVGLGKHSLELAVHLAL
jgi:hypothetical protein